MALSDYVQRTRSILEGYGLGEKPVILQVAADAGNTISGSTVAVTLLDGTNSGKVRAGDVLSQYAPTTEALAWVGYVLSVNGTTDVVTLVNGYEGTTAITSTTATQNDGGLLYLHGDGTPSDHQIINAVNTVFNTLLYPSIFKLEFDTETANLSHGRVDLDAEVEEIDQAWQIVGVDRVKISYGLEKQSPSVATAATAGVVGVFDPVAAGTIYLSTIRRMVVGDESTYDSLVEVVALGAAAIAAGFSRPETTLAVSKKDSRERGRAPDIGQALWRDFFTIRDSWADDIARETADEIEVYRG